MSLNSMLRGRSLSSFLTSSSARFSGASRGNRRTSSSSVDVVGNDFSRYLLSKMTGDGSSSLNGIFRLLSTGLNGIDSAFSGLGKGFSNLWRKMTGSGLTDAEREANEFTEYMSSTQYQRGVADQQAAGLNPAMMYGSAGASSSPSSVSPGSSSVDPFQVLVSALSLPLQLKKLSAETGEILSKTQSLNLDNEFKGATMEARKLSETLKNQLTGEQISQISDSRKAILQNIEESIARTDNEKQKKLLTMAQIALEKAKENEIASLLPFNKELLSAKTEHEKAAAAYDVIQTMYQQGLIDAGYIDDLCNTMVMNAKANMTSASAQYSLASANAAAVQIKNNIKQGKPFGEATPKQKMLFPAISFLATDAFKIVSSVTEAIAGPLGSIINK